MKNQLWTHDARVLQSLLHSETTEDNWCRTTSVGHGRGAVQPAIDFSLFTRDCFDEDEMSGSVALLPRSKVITFLELAHNGKLSSLIVDSFNSSVKVGIPIPQTKTISIMDTSFFQKEKQEHGRRFVICQRFRCLNAESCVLSCANLWSFCIHLSSFFHEHFRAKLK